MSNAIDSKYVETVRFLLENGCDPSGYSISARYSEEIKNVLKQYIPALSNKGLQEPSEYHRILIIRWQIGYCHKVHTKSQGGISDT